MKILWWIFSIRKRDLIPFWRTYSFQNKIIPDLIRTVISLIFIIVVKFEPFCVTTLIYVMDCE